MSHLDSSEHDDRKPDKGRTRRPARPAWDAATYGVPEDTRRSRRRAPEPDHPPDPDPYAYHADPYPYADPPPAPPPYQSKPYQAEPYQSKPYQAEPYQAEPYQAEPYQAEPYQAEPYRSEAPYPSAPTRPLDGYPQAPSYRAEPYRYEPPSTTPYEPTPYEPAQYEPTPYEPAQYEPTPYEPAQYEPTPYEPPHDPSYESHWSGDRGRDEPYDRYPGGVADDSPAEPAEKTSGRAGRNVPAAIGVGVLLIGVVLAALFLWRPAFFGVVALAVGIGIWELVRAIRTNGVNPPMIPLVVGGALMTGLAWRGQADALTFGLIITVLAAMAWRLADGAGGYGRDVTAATLVAVYVPFLAGFAALLASPADGDKRVVVTLALVVLSDTGGFIAGVLFGRHPMAPRVSPKKSWEGLGGSFVAAGVGGAILLGTLFHVSVFWGVLFGVAIAAAAVLGDLAESMIKRDLGVKDMSNLLPGHGGLMDRLDSIVVAAPTAYLLLVLIVPPV